MYTVFANDYHVSHMIPIEPVSLSYAARHTVGLDKLCRTLLLQSVDKSMQMSNWEDRPMSNAQRVYAATDAYVLLPLLEALLRSLKAVSAGAGGRDVGDKEGDGGVTCVGTATLTETMDALPSLLESDATITDGTAALNAAASVGDDARGLLVFEGIRRWVRPLSVSMVSSAASTLAAGAGAGVGAGGRKDGGNGSGKGGGKCGGKSGGGGDVLEAMEAMGRSDVAAALRGLGLGQSADRIHQSSKGMGGMNGVGGLRVGSGGETGGDGTGGGGGGDGDGGDDYGEKGGDQGGTKGIMVKTLCLIARESEVVLCVLRLDRRLQVSKCASAMGVRRCDIRMAREEELVMQCGYRRGSIGPVGSRNTATVLVRRRELTERPERERR